MLRKLGLLFAFCCFVSLGMAQNYSSTNKKAIKLFEEGMDFGRQRKDDMAVKKLQDALRLDPKFGEAYLILGQIYQDQNNLKDAVEAYQSAVAIDEKKFADGFLYIGDICMKTAVYDYAAKAYRKFIQFGRFRNPQDKMIYENYIAHAEFADSLMKNPVEFVPRNLGSNINSVHDEYHPTLPADESFIIYTVRAPSATGTCIKDKEEDFYISYKTEKGWTPRENMGGPINSACNEGAGNISPDGRFLFFAAQTRNREDRTATGSPIVVRSSNLSSHPNENAALTVATTSSPITRAYGGYTPTVPPHAAFNSRILYETPLVATYVPAVRARTRK